MKFKAVIFDLDGTLLDTVGDLADSMNAVLERLNFPTHPEQAYKYFVGDGIVNLVKRALPENCRDNEELIEQCVKLMSEEYGKRWHNKTKPYDGIEEMLGRLEEKKVKKSVLSNKPHEFTVKTVEFFFPRYRFEIVRGVGEDGRKKPDPYGALEIARSLSLEPEQILYVGDTATDMKTATGAGMFPVGVLWGFRTKDELVENGALKIVQSPLELLTFF